MSAPPPPSIRVARAGGRLEIVLDRPDRRNAFDDRVVAELTLALEAGARDPGVRCLVLSATGPVFCAGADLQWMRAMAAAPPATSEADARAMAAMFQALEAFPCLTVAKVQGAALGGGGGLVSCVDVAVAAADARFGFTEVRLGIIPAVISGFVLRRIPVGAARRYFATGEIFDAARAERIGLVSEVVPAEELDRRVEAIVAQAMSVGPQAAREAKRLVARVAGAPLEDALEETAAWIAAIRATPEAKEGMAAFLEKRAPRWPEGSS